MERDAVALRGALDVLPVPEDLAQARAIGLDPSTADEDEPFGGLEDRAPLGVRERLAVDREARGEVEHGVGRELRGRFPPDPDDDLRPRGRARRPPVGHAHGNAGALEHGHLLQERVSLARGPGERMVDVAAVDERPHERALLRRTLDRQQQREELLAIASRARLFDRVTERPVLRRALRRQARRVRREEREGAFGVALVLGQVEHHAAHGGPRRVLRVQPFGDGSLPARHLRGERLPRLAPDRLEGLGGDVLGAAHGRGACGQRREPVGRRIDASAPPKRLQVGSSAEARDELVPQRAEEPEGGGQRRPNLDGPEVKHTRSRAALERRGDGGGTVPVEGVFVGLGGSDPRAAARRNGEGQRARGPSRRLDVRRDHRRRFRSTGRARQCGRPRVRSAAIDNLCQPHKLSDIAKEWSHRAIPTRNVNLTEELDSFVAAKVASGRYENASEVVRASLRALEREEQEYDARLTHLRRALEEGEASGDADDYSLEGLIAELDREKVT